MCHHVPVQEHTSELLIKAFDEAYNGNRGEGRLSKHTWTATGEGSPLCAYAPSPSCHV